MEQKEPNLDTAAYQAFRVHFQQAVLLSLLESGKLTHAQYEACMEKVAENAACKP